MSIRIFTPNVLSLGSAITAIHQARVATVKTENYLAGFEGRLQLDLLLFGTQRSIRKRLSNVFCFEIRVEFKNLGAAVSFRQHADDHSNRDPHPANTRLTAHHLRVYRYAVNRHLSTLPANLRRLKDEHPNGSTLTSTGSQAP